MTDIVERLRKGTGDGLRAWDFMNEAADEIERLSDRIVDLESKNEELREEIGRLRNTLKSMEEGTDLQRRDMETEIFRLRAEAGYD